MKKMLILLVSMVILGSLNIAVAQDLIHEWNADTPAQDMSDGGMLYAPNCYALQYSPPEDFLLERVDFVHGDAGDITVWFFSGEEPDEGELLTEITYTQSAELGWQGEAFTVPVQVSAGQPYWVIISPVNHSPISICELGDGTPTPMKVDFNCDGGYSAFVTGFSFKVRFYGTATVATENVTWDRVKGLYR